MRGEQASKTHHRLTVVPGQFLNDRLAAVNIPHVNIPILRARDNALIAVKARGHRVALVLVSPGKRQ